MAKYHFFIGVVSALVIGGAIVAFIALQKPVADAFSDDDGVRGWAWSSTIGWISFNCADQGVCGSSNYAVRMNRDTGVFSGYGWSSNIGWVDFAPGGAYPAAPVYGVRADLASGTITGWARALAYGDGWDGWIKITDAKIGQGGVIKNSAGTEGGWAWGGNVVGWLNFSNPFASVTVPHVDCDLSADPARITPPQKANLSWRCNRLATACAIDQGIGNVGVQGIYTVRPAEGTTYTLTCQGIGGPAVKAAKVDIATAVKIQEVSP